MEKLPQKVTPADCTLAVAIPLSCEQFLSDLLASSKKYAKGIALSHAGASANFVWTLYEPTAKFIERIGRDVGSLGVRVHYESRLEDLATLLPTCAVFTLVAHLDFEPIQAEEILDAIGILRRLEQPDTELCCLLQSQIGDTAISRLSSCDADKKMALAGQIASLLNALVDQKSGEPPSVRTLERFTRNQIEHVFAREMTPSRPIELFDGMHTVDEFVAAIPPDHGGVIDLSICNSTILAESIKGHARHCTVISNEMPATPVFKLTRYKIAIHQLAKRPQSYIEVITRVHTGR